MSPKLTPVGHEHRMGLVDHLDELRSRLIICIVVFAAAFALCMWQNGPLLNILNQPLENTTTPSSGGTLENNSELQAKLRRALDSTAVALATLQVDKQSSPAQRRALAGAVKSLGVASQALPRGPTKRQPVTLGVSEPFTTTLTVAGAFALIISLPVLLFQLYAFIIPAFSPRERKVALPLMLMVPFLFISGVVFGYYAVLPPAVKFLQSFNDSSFDILVQAKDYYRFELLVLLSMGILFQIPIGVLAVTRTGIVSVQQLRKNRRYAILIIAVVAMLLPGTDPVSMLLAMLPLIVLYEASIILAAWLDRRAGSYASDEVGIVPSDSDDPPQPTEPPE